MDFDAMIDRVLGDEGGYVNHPSDPGGVTNWGISQRAYPNIDIKSLTREQAKTIYAADYYARGQMEQLPPAVAYQVLDIAVNHGVGTAVRMLQRCVGVADDGHVGPVTIKAVNERLPTDIIMLLVSERIEFWTKLSTWPTFGKGWARRAAANLRYGASDT